MSTRPVALVALALASSLAPAAGAAPPRCDLLIAGGRVVDGMGVVDAIEKAPREGEAPTPRIDLLRVRVLRKPN